MQEDVSQCPPSTSKSPKLGSTMGFQTRRFGSGSTLGRSKDIPTLSGRDTSTLNPKPVISFLRRKRANPTTSSIVGSPHPNKRTISRDKSSSPESNTQNTISSKTSALVSTGNERDLSPYWIESRLEESKALLSSIGTDSVALASTYFNNSSNSLELNSWFTNKTNIRARNKSSQKISCQSFISTPVVTWQRDVMEPNPKTSSEKKKKNSSRNVNKKVQTRKQKSLKFKIDLSEQQKETLKTWFGACRYVYNLCVDHVKEQNITSKISPIDFAKLFVTAKGNSRVANGDTTLGHIFETVPKDVYSNIVRDFCSSFNTNIQERNKADKGYVQARIKAKELEKEKELSQDPDRIEAIDRYLEHVKNMPCYINNKFDMRYKTKKDPTEYIKLQHCKSKFNKDKRSIQIFNSKKYNFGSFKLLGKKKLRTLKHDFIIRFSKPEGWHVIVPIDYDLKPHDDQDIGNITAIDPGIRTFLTTCDTQGQIKEYGVGWVERLGKKLKDLDSLKASMERHRTNKNRILYLRTKDRAHQVERKLYAMRDDMHKKVAKDILKDSDHIILPKLQSNFVVKRKGGNKALKRQFNLASHCSFHDYISWKALKESKIVLDLDERYTTKTCLKCGTLNDIGSSKRYECKNCLYQADRDVSSAFNILTKHLGCYRPRTL